MWGQSTRRDVLKGIGAIVSTAALGPQVVAAERMEGRFIVDTSNVDVAKLRRNGNITVVHDMDSEIEHVVCRGSERAVESLGEDVNYTQDVRFELSVPREESGPTAEDVESTDDEPAFFGFQWDKDEQDILSVHEEVTGDGARIGIIDTGVLGASEQFSVSHPDLTTINEELSASFVPRPEDGGDTFGAGPLAIDHGTHVAGTAAASGAGGGVVGMAPDAEVVDIRVFSGLFATFGDVFQAVVYGATREADGGAGCDALNLSLGSGPLLPIDPEEEIDDEDDPDGEGPIFPIHADDLAILVHATNVVGTFAVENGALPIAAAGNDGVNLDMTFEAAFDGTIELSDDVAIDFDGSAVSLPNEADGFMSIAAAGPIGFGWPGDGDSIAGLPIEADIHPELRSEEPAFYTNYGPDAVDVSAAGGNADIDPILADADVQWFYDLVFNSAFLIPDGNVPPDTQLGNDYTPAYGWKAGTSFAAPTTTGLAALLVEKDPTASPEAIRDRIEATAQQTTVGLVADDDEDDDANGETTAPAQGISIDAVLDSGKNVALDDVWDGDEASSPDSVDLTDPTYDSANFRGHGHIDVSAAVDGFGGSGS